jgi:hypothetical protein
MQKLQIPQVTAVTRQPEKDSWVYVAHLDNEPIRIRKSKHVYNIAHQYDVPVAGGNKLGLRRFFTFGTSPDRYYRHALVRSFGIEEL